MKEIFLNAKFGEMFKTRDGRRAVCLGFIDNRPYFSIEGYTMEFGIMYLSGDSDATFLKAWLYDDLHGGGDIVSRWED